MIVIDTNVLGALTKTAEAGRITAWFDAQDRTTLWTTTITLAEMRFGTEREPQGKRRRALEALNARLLAGFFPAGRIAPFDTAAAESFGRIVAAASKRGKPVAGFADAAIAAIATVRGFAVATRDVGPFDSLGVPTVNPWTET